MRLSKFDERMYIDIKKDQTYNNSKINIIVDDDE